MTACMSVCVCACVFCLLTVSVEMWLRLHWCGFSDAQTAARCSSEILPTASAHPGSLCDCRGSSSSAQMGMLFGMQAAVQIVEIANCVSLMLHRILSARFLATGYVLYTRWWMNVGKLWLFFFSPIRMWINLRIHTVNLHRDDLQYVNIINTFSCVSQLELSLCGWVSVNDIQSSP